MSWRNEDFQGTDRFRAPDREGPKDRMTFSEKMYQQQLQALEAAANLALGRGTSAELQATPAEVAGKDEE